MKPVAKAFIALNVFAAFVLALFGLSAAGGFVSGVFPPDEGHEMKLVRIESIAEEGLCTSSRVAERVEIPAEYRKPDPTPSPWVVASDGSVRFVRSE